MKINARALNTRGVELFQHWLTHASNKPAPFEYLNDPQTSEPVPGATQIERRTFSSRYELGVYLEAALENCRPPVSLPEYTGLWTGLSLFYIDQLCPASGTGSRRVRALDLYIPSESFHRYYRHLIRTAVLMVRQYGELARYVLASSEKGINHSQFTEDLTARREVLSNPKLIEAAGKLYFDERKKLLKRGASSSRGSVRRFIKVLMQFDVNFDLYGDQFSFERAVELLPNEFQHWRSLPHKNADKRPHS